VSSLFRAVRCLECGREGAADLYAEACPACGGGWLEACYDLDGLPPAWPDRLRERPSTLWRYGELLPFADGAQPVSMGEGWTPLYRAAGLERELGHAAIWIKDERQQPTGSFKDRQAASTITALQARGIREMVLASTGNAAAGYAAYCARAGIKLWVFLTTSVPAEKVRELGLYGAEVVKVSGTYDQAKEIAAEFAGHRGIFLDRGARTLPGKESMKTIAFEIAEQLGWRAPDWYVQAVSGGIGPLGVMKGFQELCRAGLIARVPKLAVVQAEGCAPMVRAWERGCPEAEPVRPDTLILVLATGNPGPAYRLLKGCLDAHGGVMCAVGDGDAFRAMRRVARLEGLSVEPAASVAFAGLEELLARGAVRPGETVVVNASGHTFSAEKHVLEDRFVLHLEDGADLRQPVTAARPEALARLDEQVTTIVIIDDNPSDSRLIRRLLQRTRRYRVFEAHTGADGIDLVRQRRPDLVVLDLGLPEMDGFGILEALRADERTRHVPVIIISAKSLTPGERDRLARETDSIWQKGSFSAADLVGHVVARLGGELEPAEQAARDTAPGREELARAFGQPQRQRILLVDANELDARLLQRLFEAQQRFEVTVAHTGQQALAALEADVPDLLVVDPLLPDIAEARFLELLQEGAATRRVPVIVVSAAALEGPRRVELTAQVESVWSKGTLDRNSLLAHVETVLPA
jgi:threonine synthase